eukprot:3316175-Amphidinium_carterae.1
MEADQEHEQCAHCVVQDTPRENMSISGGCDRWLSALKPTKHDIKKIKLQQPLHYSDGSYRNSLQNSFAALSFPV